MSQKSIKSLLVSCSILISSFVYAAVPIPNTSPIPVVINENTLIQTPTGIIPANKINEKELPSLLMPWVDWIKAKNLQELCLLNNENEKTCVFAPEISINETEDMFSFQINGTSLLKEFWIKIPSGQSQKVWPENILMNNKKGQVLEKDGFALVKVNKGDFIINFNINKEELKLSPGLMLSKNFLIVNNKTNASWIAENNQLIWITKKVDDKNQSISSAKNEEIKIYRKLTDDIPLRLETRIQIIYSGKEKEIFLGKLLPDKFNLLQIQSDLSINQKEDGYYVKAISGEHWLSFYSYAFQNLKIINIKNLVNQNSIEYWSVENNLNIRQLEIKSATAIDPRQAFVPEEWRSFPAYSVKDNIIIDTIRRGLNRQENLSYTTSRNSWYGFNNEIMLHQDKMAIINDGKPFIDFNTSVTPKEFNINEQPQMIVEYEKKQGIVLKQGSYSASLQSKSLTSLSPNFINDSKQNISHWNLNLAPRNRLLYVSGVDRAVDSWTDNWNLYTVFAIFLISLGFYKLFGLPLAILSFSSILLFQTNPFLSWTFWPALLLLMALLKVLPKINKFTKLVRFSSIILVLSLSFIFVTFTVTEIRYIVNGSLEQNISSNNESAMSSYGASVSPATPPAAPIAMSPGRVMNKTMSDSMATSVVREQEFQKEIKSIETQKVQVTTGRPTWNGLHYKIIPSSLMDDKVDFYIAKPWLVNLASMIQIFNLLIVWIFLIMYVLNIFDKNQILNKIPEQLRKNKLVNSFTNTGEVK